MKKVVLLVIFFLFTIIFFIAYFAFCSNDDVLKRKGINNYLFNISNLKVKQRCYKDLIGLSIDGSYYDFYKYETFNIDTSNLVGEYPKFDSIFDVELSNDNFSYWRKTPIEDKELKYPFDIAYYGNLDKNNCARKFKEQDYLRKSDSYYSFIGMYPIGTYLFIYSPQEKMLYVIVKK